MPGQVILAFMAHPDDAEFLCAGALFLLADLGCEVHVAAMAPGDCGSPDKPAEEIAAIRREEGRRAAALYPGEFHCLEERDLQIHYSPATTKKACSLFRKVRPQIVITQSPVDYMLDHEETARIARAACFNAPIPNAPCEDDSAPLDRIPHLYYVNAVESVGIYGEPVKPSFLVDIADVMDRKTEALAAHESQREWLRKQHGIDEYLESMNTWSAEAGKLAGLEFAEGFRQHLGHAYPRDNLLASLLEGRCHQPETGGQG